jgi:hypothetical protein
MSVMDDFNRALFDRAKSKYNRAQFEQITTDEWCALVEGLRAQVAELEAEVSDLEFCARQRD